MPAPKLTMLAFFRTVREAGEAVAGIDPRRCRPATLELMDRSDHPGGRLRRCAWAWPRDAGAMLMIESDAGGAGGGGRRWRPRRRACDAAGATSVIRANDPTEADWLREARRKAHWSLEQAGVARMEDVGVARSRIPS